MATRRETVEERFWIKVDQAEPDECWPWNRSRRKHGYGQFRVRVGESPQISSRVAWRLTRGEIPEGLAVCHRCDNPPCCNPNHLFLGTTADNTADMVAKQRHAMADVAAVGELVQRVRRLSDAQIVEARQLREAGLSYRVIAAQYGVQHTTIMRLVNGTHWKSTAA